MIGFLIMLKNEEISIITTLNSIKNFAKNLFIFDTGCTDRTIEIIRFFCKKNNIDLYIEKKDFENFAISRNNSIEFAENICKKKKIEYLVLLDAGDEFKCSNTREELNIIIKQNFSPKMCYGVIKKIWLVNKSEVLHRDVRFIRVGYNCRYDTRYPVHETFKDKKSENMILLGDLIVLYQNRELYGKSTETRLYRDIEMLSNAEQNNRNLYYLAQTYTGIGDYETSIKKYKECLEKVRVSECSPDDMGEVNILISLVNIYFSLNDYDNVLNYVKEMIVNKYNQGYMFLLKYCIISKNYKEIEPYIENIMNYKLDSSSNINDDDYYYKRWNLLTLICIELKNLKYARLACQNAISAKNDIIDKKNMAIIELLETVEKNSKTEKNHIESQ